MPTPVLHGPANLKEFADKCEKALLSAEPQPFVYPLNATSAAWPVDQIREDNEPLLRQLRNAGNVYALFTRDSSPGASWQVRYVGERKSDGLRGRMTEHLIKKDARTGSKLANVQAAVSQGQSIGISFIKVEPESLRLYVEETIIARNKPRLPWNTQG